MTRAPNAFRLIVLLLATSVVFPADDLVSPDKIAYDDVPGIGKNAGTETFDWTEQVEHLARTLEPQAGLKIRWLGTAGFEISDDDTTILVDPFVSRPPVPQALLDEIPINTEAVDRYVLRPVEKQSGGLERIKVILISHTHYDHVQDAPYILARFPNLDERPMIVGDPNLAEVLKRYRGREKEVPWLDHTPSLDKSRQMIIPFGQEELPPSLPASKPFGRFVGRFGNFKVTAFVSWHALYDDLTVEGGGFTRFFKRLFGLFSRDKYLSLALEGPVTGRPPYHSSDLKSYLNTSMTYLIEYKNQFRIFAVDSPRFLHADDVSKEVGPIDLLLEGIASRKHDNAISARISGFHPRYVVPTHFDNFFVPFDRFQTFDYKITLKTDNSNLRGFLQEFKTLVETQPEPRARLRMLRMFYYYSMESLLRRPQAN